MLQMLKPQGRRRAARRLGFPSTARRGVRRAARPNWVTGEPGPAADALAIDLMLGYDPLGWPALMGISGKKNEIAKAAKKKAKRQAKGNGVSSTNAGRLFGGIMSELDRDRRTQGGGDK